MKPVLTTMICLSFLSLSFAASASEHQCEKQAKKLSDMGSLETENLETVLENLQKPKDGNYPALYPEDREALLSILTENEDDVEAYYLSFSQGKLLILMKKSDCSHLKTKKIESSGIN